MSSTSSGPQRPTIYVCDPSAEATKTESALTQAGYDVIDVPRHRLVERVRLERPAAVVLDVADLASLGVVAQIRATSGGEAIHLLFVAASGGPLRDAEDALMRDGSGLFLRPVDASALVRKIEALVGPGDVRRERNASLLRQPVQNTPDELPSGRSLDAAMVPSVQGRHQQLPELADDIRSLLAAADLRAASLDLSGAAPPLDGEGELDLVLGGEDMEGIAPPDEEGDVEGEEGRLLTASGGQRSGKSDDERILTQTPLQAAKQRRTTASTATRSSTAPGNRGATPPTSRLGRFAESPARSLRDAALASPKLPAEPVDAPSPRTAPTGLVFGLSHAPDSRIAERTLPPAAPQARADIPATLARHAAPGLIASLIHRRATGILTFADEGTSRTITLREGDCCSVQSTHADDSLLRLLERRGFLPQDALLGISLSPIPRLACAALVARGHLAQDDLWPVLRLHAEQVLAGMIASERGTVPFADGSVPDDAPSPFGALSGSAVFVRAFCICQNVTTFAGRADRRPFQLVPGECYADRDDALGDVETARDLDEWLELPIDGAAAERLGPALVTLEALVHLHIIGVVDRLRAEPEPPIPARSHDGSSIDADALRQRIHMRRRLVDEGDYFTLLGVTASANGFEIRQAYLELRRSFEPSRVLQFAELHAFEGDVRTILEVVEEAYQVLRDDARRDRYRRAIGLA